MGEVGQRWASDIASGKRHNCQKPRERPRLKLLTVVSPEQDAACPRGVAAVRGVEGSGRLV